MVCPNCETVYEGNFCPECGQKTIHGRYTVKGLLTDLVFSTIQLEKKGLPYTIKELTIRPGIAIRNVLEGQRLSLYPPFKYLVLIGTIVVILSLRYGFFHNEELTSVNAVTYQTTLISGDEGLIASISRMISNILFEYKVFLDGFFKFAEDYATLLNLVSIPIFSFFNFIFFYRSGYNFAENLIINTFITAQQLLFLIILVPFIEFFPGSKHILIPIYSIGIMLYNVFAYVQLYGVKFSNIFRAVITVITAFLYQFPANFAVYYVAHNYIIPIITKILESKL